jgi:hypothetical protein
MGARHDRYFVSAIEGFDKDRCPAPLDGVVIRMEPYPTLAITTTALPNAAPSISYSERLMTTGGNDSSYRWSLKSGSLPGGLSLHFFGGAITGTPAMAGTWNFTVEVTDLAQIAQQTLSITVSGGLVLRPIEHCSEHPDTAIATFEESELQGAVRTALGVGPHQDLTCGLVSGLTVLDAHREVRGVGIASLVGVQNLASLTDLDLNFNNRVTDISPLSGLTNLTDLNLAAMQGIIDISPLSGLTSLDILRLSDNPTLTDIQPLLENPGIGAGDEVNLWNTNVSCPDVDALKAKGVVVTSSCP